VEHKPGVRFPALSLRRCLRRRWV